MRKISSNLLKASAFPLVLYFRKYQPDVRITLFVDGRNSPLIPYLPPVEEVVVLPTKGNKYWNLFRVAMHHRRRFDQVYSAKTSPMKLMNLFLYWLGGKERFAYVDSSWHRILINRPLSFDEVRAKSLHQALKGLHMVAPELEDVPEEFYPHIPIPEACKEKSCSLESPIVLVTASTTRPASRFDIDRYSALLNRLYANHAFSVLVIGQPKDELRARALADRIQAPHQIHFPRNFDEFMVLLGLSDLYFVGDGGVAHLGAALGKKAVVLYGETSPIEWRPLSRDVEIFFHPQHVDHLSDHEIFCALRRKLEA